MWLSALLYCYSNIVILYILLQVHPSPPAKPVLLLVPNNCWCCCCWSVLQLPLQVRRRRHDTRANVLRATYFENHKIVLLHDEHYQSIPYNGTSRYYEYIRGGDIPTSSPPFLSQIALELNVKFSFFLGEVCLRRWSYYLRYDDIPVERCAPLSICQDSAYVYGVCVFPPGEKLSPNSPPRVRPKTNN
jgi:hypothetical protein